MQAEKTAIREQAEAVEAKHTAEHELKQFEEAKAKADEVSTFPNESVWTTLCTVLYRRRTLGTTYGGGHKCTVHTLCLYGDTVHLMYSIVQTH